MKKEIILSAALILSACSAKEARDEFSLPDYRQWRKPVPEVLDYPVPGHGAGQRIIYGNDLAFAPSKKVSEGKVVYNFPDQSVIVKEIYKPGEDLNSAVPALTIMVKNPKESAARDGWIYFMRPPGGELMRMEGKMCSGCHSAANEASPYFDKNPGEDFRDFVFAPFFDGAK